MQKERQAVTTGRATAASTKVIGKRKLKDDAEIEESISKKANTNVLNAYQFDEHSLKPG